MQQNIGNVGEGWNWGKITMDHIHIIRQFK